MSALIASDDFVATQLESKFLLKQRQYSHVGVCRIVRALDEHILQEMSRMTLARAVDRRGALQSVSGTSSLSRADPKTESLGVRSRRDVRNARQLEIVEGLNMIKDRILLTMEDAYSHQREFHDTNNQSLRSILSLLQAEESHLVTVKQKWSLRVSPFTKQVMDDLQNAKNTALSVEELKRRERFNGLLFTFAQLSIEILTDRLLRNRNREIDWVFLIAELTRLESVMNGIIGKKVPVGVSIPSAASLSPATLMEQEGKLITVLIHALQFLSLLLRNQLHRSKTHQEYHELVLFQPVCVLMSHAMSLANALRMAMQSLQNKIAAEVDVFRKEKAFGMVVGTSMPASPIGKRHHHSDRSPHGGRAAQPTNHSTSSVAGGTMNALEENEVADDEDDALVDELRQRQAIHERELRKAQLLMQMLLTQSFDTLQSFADVLSASIFLSSDDTVNASTSHALTLRNALEDLWSHHYESLTVSVSRWTRRIVQVHRPSHNTFSSFRRESSRESLRNACIHVGESLSTLAMRSCSLLAGCLMHLRSREVRKDDRKSVAARIQQTAGSQVVPSDITTPQSIELSLAATLLASALRVSVAVCARTAVILGIRGHLFCASLRDALYFQQQDTELIAALDLAATGFALGVLQIDRPHHRQRRHHQQQQQQLHHHDLDADDDEDEEAVEERDDSTHSKRSNLDSSPARILKDACQILAHRSGSFLLSNAFIKCALAAATFLLHCQSIPLEHQPLYRDLTSQQLQRLTSQCKDIEESLFHAIDRIFVIFATHRLSLSMCHHCMLLIRMLFRESFCETKTRMEDIVSIVISQHADCYNSEAQARGSGYEEEEEEYDSHEEGQPGMGPGEREREDEDEQDNETASAMFLFLDQSVASAESHLLTSQQQQQRSGVLGNHSKVMDSMTVGSLDDQMSFASVPEMQSSSILAHNGKAQSNNMNNEVPVEVYLRRLRTQLLSAQVFDGLYETGNNNPHHNNAAAQAFFGVDTLPELLCFVAQNHQQTSTVMEQALLLIQHLGSKSSLARFQLIETGLPLILSRFLDTKPPSVYVAALCEICIELLEV